MNISDRGAKHTCSECSCKYYDLKDKITACPKCGAKTPAPLARGTRRVGKGGRTPAWRYP